MRAGDSKPRPAVTNTPRGKGGTLGVPIYLHPTLPPQPVIDAYYGGFEPELSALLSAAGVGQHIDTGIHCLRLIPGGVFDRFPRLQIIAGHQFEALSWMA